MWYNFKHIDTIRDKKGKLRSWEDYEKLSILEDKIQSNQISYRYTEEQERQNCIISKHEFIDYEQRSSI